MIVSIAQPAYLPWAGYFDRIAKSDIHIILDHVQFEKGSFTNRTRIREKSERGWQWLTVPVEKGRPINETQIDHTLPWQRKHRRAIEQQYGSIKGYWFPVGTGGNYQWNSLAALCLTTTQCLVHELGLRKNLWLSSYLVRTRPLGHKSELVLNLCKEMGATVYLSGPLGRNYLDLASFERAGIEVVYHDYRAKDDPPLSIIDTLLSPSPASGVDSFA